MNLKVLGANDIITRLVRNVDLLSYARDISLHTDNPGSSGANEVTGGSYIRTSLTFNAAAAGSISNFDPLDIFGMPACIVSYLGFWSAEGVFLASAEFNEAVVVGNGETFHIDAGALVITLGSENGTAVFGNFLLDRFARGVNYITAPVSISLHTANPGTTGASEVTDPGYSRTVVPAESWDVAANSEISNSANIDFPNLLPKTVTHFGVWSEAGVYLLTVIADPAIVLTLPSQTLRIPPGLLTIRVTEAEFAGWNGWVNRNGPATSFNQYPDIDDGLTRVYFSLRGGATGNNRFRSLLKSDLTTFTAYTMPANHLGVISILPLDDDETVFIGTVDSGGAVAYKFLHTGSAFTNITWPGASSDGILMLAKHPTDSNLIFVANQAQAGSGSVRLYTFNISGGTWTQVGGDGLNSSWNVSSTNKSCSSLAFLGTSTIYAMIAGGTANQLDVYSAPLNMSTWTRIAGGALNGSWATGTKRNGNMIVVNGKLYAAIGGSTAGDAEVWRWDGVSWTQIGGDGLNSSWVTGTKLNASRIAFRGNRVVVGLTGSASGDSEIWQYNLSTGLWTQIGGDGINSSWSTLAQVNAIHVDREGVLWASPSDNSTGTPLFFSNHPL